MIPTVLVLGLVIGLVPRPWFQWLAVLAGLCWTTLLVINGTVDAGDTMQVLLAFVFGLVNAFVGATVTRVVGPMIRDAVRSR